MTERINHLGQPIGFPLPDWQPRQRPPATPMRGRTCDVVPLDPAQHAPDLFAAAELDTDGRNWTYLAVGPFLRYDDFRAWLDGAATDSERVFYATIDGKTGRATGVASYLRIDVAVGSIEVGHIYYSPLLQRRPAATETMYLMMRRVFDELGYRRYEWKCDALNAPSRAAAERLGFRFEGIFRQATVYKQRNRDTAWFSIIDGEWPALKAAFEAWLAPENFDAEGKQRRSLASLRRT
ncbi:MAG TPA: GNAT family protein [Stellaceae bacterium]|nr:GNAT family protein [Stellaceae bacterium]